MVNEQDAWVPCAQEAETALALVPEAAAEKTLTLHQDTCDSSGMRSLAEILLAVDGDGRIGAAISIRVLCLQNEQNKQHAADLGVISALVDMVSTGSPAANAAACGALQKVRAIPWRDGKNRKRSKSEFGAGASAMMWWRGSKESRGGLECDLNTIHLPALGSIASSRRISGVPPPPSRNLSTSHLASIADHARQAYRTARAIGWTERGLLTLTLTPSRGV